jgi:hypothetical protein
MLPYLRGRLLLVATLTLQVGFAIIEHCLDLTIIVVCATHSDQSLLLQLAALNEQLAAIREAQTADAALASPMEARRRLFVCSVSCPGRGTIT